MLDSPLQVAVVGIVFRLILGHGPVIFQAKVRSESSFRAAQIHMGISCCQVQRSTNIMCSFKNIIHHIQKITVKALWLLKLVMLALLTLIQYPSDSTFVEHLSHFPFVQLFIF